jgi:hypothetical protein
VSEREKGKDSHILSLMHTHILSLSLSLTHVISLSVLYLDL